MIPRNNLFSKHFLRSDRQANQEIVFLLLNANQNMEYIFERNRDCLINTAGVIFLLFIFFRIWFKN